MDLKAALKVIDEGRASFQRQAEEARIVMLKAMGAAEACIQMGRQLQILETNPSPGPEAAATVGSPSGEVSLG